MNVMQSNLFWVPWHWIVQLLILIVISYKSASEKNASANEKNQTNKDWIVWNLKWSPQKQFHKIKLFAMPWAIFASNPKLLQCSYNGLL